MISVYFLTVFYLDFTPAFDLCSKNITKPFTIRVKLYFAAKCNLENTQM